MRNQSGVTTGRPLPLGGQAQPPRAPEVPTSAHPPTEPPKEPSRAAVPTEAEREAWLLAHIVELRRLVGTAHGPPGGTRGAAGRLACPPPRRLARGRSTMTRNPLDFCRRPSYNEVMSNPTNPTPTTKFGHTCTVAAFLAHNQVETLADIVAAGTISDTSTLTAILDDMMVNWTFDGRLVPSRTELTRALCESGCYWLHDSETGAPIGPATDDQTEASYAAEPDGHILIDTATGEVLNPGSWAVPSTRKVYVV